MSESISVAQNEELTLVRRRPRDPALHVRLLVPSTPRGLVIVVHGYGEHAGRHALMIDTLVQHGLAVAAFDLRGHGRSAGQRGHCLHFSEYFEDLDEVLLFSRDRVLGVPLFAFGHSFGGLVLASYALVHPHIFEGLTMTSPLFGNALEVPWTKRAQAHLASRVAPSFTRPSGLKAADVARKPGVAEAYERDPWVHRLATARWYTETLAAQEDVLARAHLLVTPMLVVVAGEDRIADVTACRQVMARVRADDKTLEVLPGLYHEVLNEESGPQTAARIARWIVERSGPTDRRDRSA